MARGRNCEGGGPFIRPEDLHMWLISFALLMVLTSSLSFASNQFRPTDGPLWVEFAIVVNWSVAFGACVIMWSLARLFNSEKTEWKLLSLSLFSVLVPRSCLPFRFGEFVMHQMCFMGFNFFTDHISWKTNTFCGLSLIIMTVADFIWSVIPPFVALMKFYAFVITVIVGNLGYRIVQVFYRQLREAKRPARPTYACVGSNIGYRDKWIKSADPPKAAMNQAMHSFLLYVYRQHTTAPTGEFLRPADPSSIGQRHLQFTRNSVGASSPIRGFSRKKATSPTLALARRYWTKLDNCSPLYFQAVHRRLILCKDDMFRYVVEIEDSGVWNKEKELQLFAVPSCHYGYVDSMWYLDMTLPAAYGGRVCCRFENAVHSRKVLPAASTQSEGEALNGAGVWMRSPAAAYTALTGIDSVKTVERYSYLFRSAVSLEHCPSDLCKSAESAIPPSLFSCNKGQPLLGTQQNAILQQHDGLQLLEPTIADTNASDATMQPSCFRQLPSKEDRMLNEENVHEIPPADTSQPFPEGEGAAQQRRQAEGGRRSFRLRRLGWRFGSVRSTNASRCPRLQEETRSCGCLRHPWAVEGHRSVEGRDPHASNGSGEEAVVPKVKWGVFEDSAIERWYLLWRAEYIIRFYKEICYISLLICALQCLFDMTRRYVVECLSLAIERYNDTSAAELEFLGVRLQMPSWRRTLAALWKPILQYSILSALILPMKFMESRGGKNVWKFQLLALGQAVTYTAFAFCELLGRCYIMATEPVFTAATKIPKGVELTFVVGGHLILPLFSIAVTVHLRRIPEATILVISVGSALVTIVVLSVVGWEFKIAAFFMLSRTLYALFSIMLVRAFENVRRQLFATQVLPFLMYLSTLANSQRVENLCAIRKERDHCGFQHAESSLP
ncbi:uncharacterized protein EMH_0061460 [Eimeria mitis]|uniref:Transmembrane protein n=1 Tax=Eimeria mitis TaxID=44415 RepID=U6K8T4_9EIME|nr:uncharacterized protein EMH_0061460 [Eimeria mitis]CDJ34339.1 hypothetical protein, conserved [Eimeria mitis]